MNKLADRNSLLASRAKRFVPKKPGGPGAAPIGEKIMNKEAYLEEIYNSAFEDETKKIAAEEETPSRVSSAIKGINEGAAAGGALGLAGGGIYGLASIKKINALVKKMKLPKGSNKAIIAVDTLGKAGIGALAGIAAGGLIGGTRGALYPKGRKNLWSGKRNPVGM
jgi:hypothetical protein